MRIAASRLPLITHEPSRSFFAERDEPLLRALPEDAHHAHVEAHLARLQPHELRDPQPGRVEELEHRAVAQAERCGDVRRIEKLFDIGLGERLRKARRALRRLELQRRVGGNPVLAHEELVEALEARGDPRLGARARTMPVPVAVREIAEHVGLARRPERPALPRQPGAEQAEIAAVRLERVLRQPVLEPEVVAELVEERGVALLHRISLAQNTRSGFALGAAWRGY